MVTETNYLERSTVDLADMSSEVRLLMLWANAFRLEPDHVHPFCYRDGQWLLCRVINLRFFLCHYHICDLTLSSICLR